jgi:hypothetical protein
MQLDSTWDVADMEKAQQAELLIGFCFSQNLVRDSESWHWGGWDV